MARDLHPAESRGYRELYAFTRQLADHWTALAARLGPGSLTSVTLEKGAAAARDLLSELATATERYDLHGRPAAQGAGRSIARSRGGLRDRFLERGQALRFAVEDAQHVTTLLAYLARVADAQGDADLSELCGGWERKLRRHESAVRKAAAELGADPDAAIEPLDASVFGRLAHGAGWVAGTAGEWIDRRLASRRADGQ